MPAFAQTARVEGFRELQRAFALADAKVKREQRDVLRGLAEPVRTDAEQFAASQIPRIGIPWSRMRVGVTQSSVYVAPKQRGRRTQRRRPNLAPLLLGRAMQPALVRNERNVVTGLETWLAGVGQAWERV